MDNDSYDPASVPQPLPNGDIGELTVGEMRLLESYRANADIVLREIGNIEVRKSQLILKLGQMENQAQAVLAETAKRFNIPQGETWHVTPDGKVRRGHSGGA